MQRLMLLTLTAVGLLGCSDASSPNTTDSAPAFGKTGAGGITITSIGPAKDGSQAEDLNDAGQVVGSTGTQFVTPSRAFLWTPAQPRGTVGTLQDLGTLGSTGSYAKVINNGGHVVGGSADAAGVNTNIPAWTHKEDL